jgi:diguanylate cyclase (GGDEF)-like protein/PAS domain S-box-containing protein
MSVLSGRFSTSRLRLTVTVVTVGLVLVGAAAGVLSVKSATTAPVLLGCGVAVVLAWWVASRTSRSVLELAKALNVGEPKIADESTRLANVVFNAAAEAIIVCDERARIKAVNPSFTRLTGYSSEEVVGQTPTFLQSGRHPPDFFNRAWRTLKQQGRWQGEIWHRRKNGEVRPDWVSLAAITEDSGRIVEYVALLTDITARKRDEERIRWHANFDALTELPNRQSFLTALAQSLERAQGNGWHTALLFLDLDRFKEVNDGKGHAVGDKLLQMVAKRLRRAVRETDTVGRLGGDEFTVLLERLAKVEDVTQVCQKLIETLGQPFRLDDQEIFIGVSIGVAIFPNDAVDCSDLLKRADQAMYRAKAAGRNQYRFYRSPALDELVAS